MKCPNCGKDTLVIVEIGVECTNCEYFVYTY